MVCLSTVLAGFATAAQVTLSNLTQTYNGSPRTVTVTTVPTGLNVTVTYAGSPTPPTNAGNYAVVATVDDPVETGSASGTLVINKANQTITMSVLPAITYGDEPFTVTATANSGLPITRWESTDPAVATISPSGEVTVVGAGLTSLIATQSGNSNFNPVWLAKPLSVSRSAAPLPSGTQTVTYSGNAQGLDPVALPSGLATEITYRDTSLPEPTPTPQVVYQNGPDTLDLSHLSTGLQAVGYWGMAKYVNLAGSARKLESCDVTLVTWAGYQHSNATYNYKSWADSHPDLVVLPTPGVSIPGDSGGWYHPVTLAFYDYSNDGTTEIYRLLTTQTVQAFIPWRPTKLANNEDYPYQGYAFRVPFTFPDGIILPQQVWVAASFNTQTYGTAPIGTPGPYNALNISRPSGQQVGSTLLTQTLLYKDWRWQSSTASSGPMLRLRAISSNATPIAPADVGTYEVKTQAAAYGSDGASLSTLVIQENSSPLPLEIMLSNLSQIRDGNPKPVTVNTIPEGISVTLTYGADASVIAPSVPGEYLVVATSADPNYQGQSSATLRIDDTFASWQSVTFANSGLPSEEITPTADPDGDGLSNFLEYATNLNPLHGNHPAPTVLELDGDMIAFTYRRNPYALDVNYTLQHTPNLTNPPDPLSWNPLTNFTETILSNDGSTQLVRASLVKPTGQPRYFLRLQVAP